MANIKRDEKFGIICTDLDLINAIVQWFYKIPQNHRKVWREGDTLAISWPVVFTKLRDNSWEYFSYLKRKEILEQEFEVCHADPLDPQSFANAWRDPNSIYRLEHLKNILGAWQSVYTHGAGMIPSSLEMPLITRSIAYWNERGNNLKIPTEVS